MRNSVLGGICVTLCIGLTGCVQSAKPKRVVLEPVSLAALPDPAPMAPSETFFRLGAGDYYGNLLFAPSDDPVHAATPATPWLAFNLK
ncbi:MAG: hypothetical protein AAF432_01140 [Planctomycetota bacterium]